MKSKQLFRTLVLSLSAFILTTLFVCLQNKAQAKEVHEIKVYQSKTCGCCGEWVKHLKDNGFSVKSEYLDDVTPIKQKYKIPENLTSCHTAMVNGYLIEGHVPAVAIKKLLAQKSSLKGLSVPGMPMGSPGMEGPYKEAYNVIGFKADGSEKVFMKFGAN